MFEGPKACLRPRQLTLLSSKNKITLSYNSTSVQQHNRSLAARSWQDSTADNGVEVVDGSSLPQKRFL